MSWKGAQYMQNSKDWIWNYLGPWSGLEFHSKLRGYLLLLALKLSYFSAWKKYVYQHRDINKLGQE